MVQNDKPFTEQYLVPTLRTTLRLTLTVRLRVGVLLLVCVHVCDNHLQMHKTPILDPTTARRQARGQAVIPSTLSCLTHLIT